MISIYSPHTTQQRGLSLIEAAMVLALVATFIVAVLYYYNTASENNKLQATEAEILSIEQKILQLYDANHIYSVSNLNDQVIIAAGGVPQAYIRDPVHYQKVTGIVDAFDGDVLVLPIGETDQTYTIWVGGIPVTQCTKMLTYNYGSNLTEIMITNNSAYSMSKQYGSMFKNGPKHSGIYVTEPVKAADQICNKASAAEKSGLIGLAFLYTEFYHS